MASLKGGDNRQQAARTGLGLVTRTGFELVTRTGFKTGTELARMIINVSTGCSALGVGVGVE